MILLQLIEKRRRRSIKPYELIYNKRAMPHTAKVEWPMMAHQKASLRAAPQSLVEALQLVVSMTPQGPGQQNVQREIVGALGSALDARRQRIIVSEAEVNSVKWWSL